MKVSISKGNSKMGAIPSVSLPPITTCAAGCTCAKKCYAAKLCRIYPSVKKSYENNLGIYLKNSLSYFNQIQKAAAVQRFFRWHVSGDIIDKMYLYTMARIARELPKTEFLAFTKRYDIVNAFIDDGYKIPENLHIIFSAWPGMDMPNPNNLPVAQVIFKGQEPADDWKVCGGNCTECACRGVGCWELKNGETIAFYEHQTGGNTMKKINFYTLKAQGAEIAHSAEMQEKLNSPAAVMHRKERAEIFDKMTREV